jgi:transglutaminase-like putative cysteine protease
MTAALPGRTALLSLLLAGTVAVLPHVMEQPWWVIGVFIFGAVWRYGCETHHWHRPDRVARAVLLLFLLAAIFRHYHTLLGRDPGVALLITLLGLKFLEIKTRRDFVISLFVFYLVILSSFLFSASLWLGAWALLAVVTCTAALIHLMQTPGMGMGLKGRLRLAGVMIAKSLPLMVLIYLLFPRISGTLWSLPVDAHGGLTGLSDSMRPGSIQQLSESQEVAFRVTFDGAPPSQRELYWRALILTHTDGKIWERAPQRVTEKISTITPLSNPVRYHVTLEPSNQSWLPALDLPVTVPASASFQPDFTLEYQEPVRERLVYTLSSHTRYRTGALVEAERKQDLRLPARLSPRVRALASQWRNQHSEPGDVMQAALDYFHRENFVYTLKPPLLGHDPVDEFLFDTRRGFCEHYASAFVTLMRAAGIPSRVVTGYLGGELNPTGNYLIVRQSDAHAWAEVWMPGNGWVRVDPTSAVAPERIELGLDAVRRLEQQGIGLGEMTPEVVQRAMRLGWFESTARHARWYWDLANMTWYRWVVDYGKDRQQRFLNSLGLNNVSAARIIGLGLIGAVLITLIYAFFMLRLKAAHDPAQALYLRFCQQLARVGLTRAPHEGALDFAQRCAHHRPDLAFRIHDITRLYLRARYSDRATTNDLPALKRSIAAFRP